MRHLLVIVLVIFPGVCGGWSVTTKDQCFLRGTSAVIQCFYDYPSWHSVKKVGWLKYSSDWSLRYLTSYRFQFVGDMSHNCNLRINNIHHTDEGQYKFRFETSWAKWMSKLSAIISVRDVIASVQPPTVTEGEVVTLTCRSGCNTQTNIQSVWFRERQSVRNIQFKASKEDAGRYTCALSGQEHIRSGAVSLNVQYAPKNVMLSMSPSDDIMLGSTVIFSCSCEANPPVAHSGYSLFKDGHFISDGPNHIISEVQLSDSGLYYCQAGNNITWTGSRLFQSTTTHVNVQYAPMNVSISVDSAEVTEGSDVNMTCHSNGNPPAFGYTWYRIDSASSSEVLLDSGPVLSLSPVEASHSGQYMCHTWNKHGEDNSTMLLLSVKTKDSTWIPILTGIGVSLLIALAFMLLLYWKKQKRHPDKTTERDERDSVAAETDHIYANAHVFQKCPSNEDADANKSLPEEVFYTTVTIKPKKPSQKSQIQTISPEKNDTVIYATIAKSS